MDLSPHLCPRYSKCSAPVCPLDPQWAQRVMHRSDPSCLFLSEAVKEGAEERFRMSSNEVMFQRIAEVLPSMIASVEPLKKRLARAAVTGSRWDRVMALE